MREASRLGGLKSGVTFGEGYDTTNPDLNKLLKLHVDAAADAETAQLVAMLDFFPFAKYLPIKAYDRFLKPILEIFDIIRKERVKRFRSRPTCTRFDLRSPSRQT